VSDIKDQALQKLIESVEKASPVLWQGAYRQVWIEALEFLLTAAFCLFIARLMWNLRKKIDDDEAIRGIILIGVWVFILLAFGFFLGGLDDIGNPTWEAIKNLRGLV
jgi:hypothetical protein